MKDQLIFHWEGIDLVLTPYRCYNGKVKAFFCLGVAFLLLAVYLAVKIGDFWQMPFILGACFTGCSLVYDLAAVRKQIFIPCREGSIVVLTVFGKKELWEKQDTEIVRRSTNYKPFIAIANKNNPYGRAYQISPYLTSKKSMLHFESEISPIIINQLNLKQ